MKEKEEILQVLQSFQDSSWRTNKYGIYLNGKPVYVGGKNVYSSEGIAKRKILENCVGRIAATDKQYIPYKKALNELIEAKIIEIKLLN